MAEHKYALLLEPQRKSNFKITPQPWYKERLNTKYKRKPTFVASSWTFLKEGIDDFRDGLPPIVDSSVVVKGANALSPSIRGSSSFTNIPAPRLQKMLSKEDIAFSSTLPRKRLNKNRIENIEKKLLDHPLALYPHLEESVPPDLFEDIVDLLDPSLTLNDNDVFVEEDDVCWTPPLQPLEENNNEKVESLQVKEACSGYKKAIMNSRRKTRQKDEETNKDEKFEKQNRKKIPPSQKTKIECVTKEFCDWVRHLGGENNNIEEWTVNNLFASGYETKPTLSVPVHVVELTNVPPELRADDVSTAKDHILLESSETSSYQPSWVKKKYGAWYLDPKTWKSRPANEPLTDPNEKEGNKLPETKEKNKVLDKTLSTLHGTHALKSFMEKKGSRTLKFLDNVNLNANDEEMLKKTKVK